MSKWQTRALRDVADSCLGKMLDKEKNQGDFQSYLANFNVQWGRFDLSTLQQMRFEPTESERYGLKVGDIVVCEGGEPGRCAIWRGQIPDMKIQKALHRIRVKPGYSNEFLYYRILIGSRTGELQKHFIGSTIKHLTGIALNRIEFDYPDLAEQQKIASILSTLDAKIALNNRINAELETLAKTVYDYWFVQFDFPDAQGRPYKTSGGKMVWNEKLKREIPKGWEVSTLASLISKQKNGEWGDGKGSERSDTAVTCFRGADINALNGNGDLNAPIRYVASSKADKFLAAYDLIVEISGGSPTQSTGRAALISQEVADRFDTPLVCSNFCKALTLTEPERGYEFLQHWNSLYSSGVFFGWEGKTTGIKNLQFDSFVSNHFLPIASKSVSENFYRFAYSLEKRKQTTLCENRKLSTLRDWLLPLLMNGQVRVK
jgi:type I restriction enzyme S subunit